MTDDSRRASEWIIHGERVLDDSRRAVLSIADVVLPDGVRFEQYVLRIPGAASASVDRARSGVGVGDRARSQTLVSQSYILLGS